MIKEISVLLFLNENGIKREEIKSKLKIKDNELDKAISEIKSNLKKIGLDIIDNGSCLLISTSKEVSDFVKKYKDQMYTSNFTKGARETLSIVMYLGPISKIDVDYIRGVNSQSLLNQLLLRGLIEKEIDNKDRRVTIYRLTTDFLSYLGVSNIEELPNYEKLSKELKERLGEIKNYYKEE